MHIDKLEVKGFGKLSGLTVPVKSGLNILYGSNEAGKTTLQWFIKGMLYGLSSTRRSRNGIIIPQKRFEPWDGGQYGGALEYSLDDGKTFRVERNFKNGTIQIFDSYFNDITSSFAIGRDKMPMFAEQQLGFDELTFERTVMIRQLEIRLDTDSTAALSGRIANVNSTGFEEMSFSRAEKALTMARKNYVGTGRTTTQPLDKLEAKLKQLKSEQDMLQRKQEQRQSTLLELLEIRNHCREMKAEVRFLEHIEELIKIRRALDVYLKKEAGLKEAVRHLKELEVALAGIEEGEELPAAQTVNASTAFTVSAGTVFGKQLEGRMQKWRMASVLCLTVAVVFVILLGYTAVTKGIFSSWIRLLIYSTGLLSAFTAGIILLLKPSKGLGNKNRSKNDIDKNDTKMAQMVKEVRTAELCARIRNICSNASLLCEKQLDEPLDVKQSLKDITTKLEELSQRLEQGIDAAAGIEYKPAGCFSLNDLDALLYDSSIVWLEDAWKGEMECLKKAILDASLKEKYLEGLLEDYQWDSDELQRVEEETVAVKEKITYLKHKGDALKLAHEVLLEAGMEIKRTFAPGLDSSMSTIITGLTAGRYMDLRSDDRLELKVTVPENGDVKNALMLSGAAADQMYLALRLAMADLLSAGKESLPLIMDEIFSQFDDDRAALALKYLFHSYEKKQVLIFTCKQREVELARDICGDRMNLVVL